MGENKAQGLCNWKSVFGDVLLGFSIGGGWGSKGVRWLQTRAANELEAVIHMQESTHKMPKSASEVVLSRMRLTLRAARRTLHGASCLVHAVSAWLVGARRASLRHCRGVRVDGHMTTAMHEMSTLHRSPGVHLLLFFLQRTYSQV